MLMSTQKSKVTIQDIAKASGVSVATVSRSFNIPHKVKDEVRTHVINIAEAMGYVPNSAAKALRLQKTHVIGAVLPTLDHSIYAKMINNFQSALEEKGYVVYVLTCGFDSSAIFDKVKLLIDRGAEALLVVGEILDEQLIRYLDLRRLPTICAYSFSDRSPFPSIGFDNYQATIKIIRYLMGLGHRNIAMMAGPLQGNDRQVMRVKAFSDIGNENDGCHFYLYESYRGYKIEYGESIMRKIAMEHTNVTAVICNSDVLAMGALTACRKLNFPVPDKISVIGYDNLEITSHLEPALTTLSIPAESMGSLAAEAFINKLNLGYTIHSVQLDTEIIVRSSTSFNPDSI